MRLNPRMVVVATSLALVLAAGAAAAISPHAVYEHLLTTSFPDSQLPSGFSNARVGISTPGKPARSHHVVGEVEVDVDGPDVQDGIFYEVFPTRADARADLVDAKPKGHTHFVPGGVPGYSRATSAMFAGSITGKNAFGQTVTDGITGVAVVKGNLLLGAVDLSGDNPDSGNIPAALHLLKAALRHLARVSH
jgi:hypothetical protein